MACNAPLLFPSEEEQQIINYAMREALYRILIKSGGDPDKLPLNMTLTSCLYSFSIGTEDRIKKEYQYGRILNEYRDRIPNFIYQYQMGYCEKSLIQDDELECSVEYLYSVKRPYIVQEALGKLTPLKEALENAEYRDSVKFQIFHTLIFLKKWCNLVYKDLDLNKDVVVESFENPISIKYGNLSLSTIYRVVFINFFKLREGGKIFISGEEFSTETIEKKIKDLKVSLAKITISSTIVPFGPCLSIENFKSRFSFLLKDMKPKYYIDAIIFGLNGVVKQNIIDIEDAEQRQESTLKESLKDEVMKRYLDLRERDRSALKDKFMSKFPG